MRFDHSPVPGLVDPALRPDLPVTLDVVVPLYNEEKAAPALLARLDAVFSAENRAHHKLSRVRYLLVDDGSTDRTLEAVLQAHGGDNPATLVRFTRNFGHQAALTAGLVHADADLVAVIDADLQDPPELLLDMLALWRQGNEVVYGQRDKRKAPLVKKACYRAFYLLYRFLSAIDVPLNSGDFCLMGRPVVEAMKRLPEHLRFHRGLRSWVGYPQAGLKYERPERTLGKTKYSFSKLYGLATDGIASMSTMPLKVSQFFALVFALGLGALLLVRLAGAQVSSVDLGLIAILGSAVTFFCLYILGAYLGRGYLEIKNRPPFLVREIITLPGSGEEA